jgi:hypothetical protein
MNGGVRHAVDVLEPREVAGACDGFRFFGFDAAAALLERAASAPRDDGGTEAFDAEYVRGVPSDAAIAERFERHFAEHRQFYAPIVSS